LGSGEGKALRSGEGKLWEVEKVKG
jgi:hypothetical protein